MGERNEEADAVWRVVDTWQQECNRAEARHRALEQRIRELVEKWRADCVGEGEIYADELAALIEEGGK